MGATSKLAKGLATAAVRGMDDRRSRPTCQQRPKGRGGPICTRKVRPGFDTCGRPACAAWKFAAES